MAWKQDLEKLKQQLAPEAPAPAPRPLPKPAVKPTGPVVLDDEDAVFLSAMGLKPAAPRGATAGATKGSPEATPTPHPPAPETFQEAIQDLKGLKPLAKGLPERPAPPPPPAVSAPPSTSVPALPAPEKAPEAALPEPPPPGSEPVAQPLGPMRFQLAAGMAIEVDGSLDLRGHSLSDAMERLKDRLGDGMVLAWRSLQVTLGPDPALHEGLREMLASGQAPMVARYAQAPVPMGGTQAWVLYFGPPPAQP
ncbi:MAG: Smr/MutS family protein [Geothrix sp.]|nr:Smr/MutS family protein [Geothrix sp.]